MGWESSRNGQLPFGADARRRAVIWPANAASADRPVVAHAPLASPPVGWPDDLADELGIVPRPSTYALWVDESGALHSAVRLGGKKNADTLAGLRYVLEQTHVGALPTDARLPGRRVRAVTWDGWSGELPGSPEVAFAEEGEPSIAGGQVVEAALQDVARRQQQIWDARRHPAMAWLPLLAIVIGGWTSYIEPVAPWDLVGGLIALAALVSYWAGSWGWSLRHRRRSVRAAGGYLVTTGADVEITSTLAGIQVAAGGPRGGDGGP